MTSLGRCRCLLLVLIVTLAQCQRSKRDENGNDSSALEDGDSLDPPNAPLPRHNNRYYPGQDSQSEEQPTNRPTSPRPISRRPVSSLSAQRRVSPAVPKRVMPLNTRKSYVKQRRVELRPKVLTPRQRLSAYERWRALQKKRIASQRRRTQQRNQANRVPAVTANRLRPVEISVSKQRTPSNPTGRSRQDTSTNDGDADVDNSDSSEEDDSAESRSTLPAVATTPAVSAPRRVTPGPVVFPTRITPKSALPVITPRRVTPRALRPAVTPRPVTPRAFISSAKPRTTRRATRSPPPRITMPRVSPWRLAPSTAVPTVTPRTTPRVYKPLLTPKMKIFRAAVTPRANAAPVTTKRVTVRQKATTQATRSVVYTKTAPTRRPSTSVPIETTLSNKSDNSEESDSDEDDDERDDETSQKTSVSTNSTQSVQKKYQQSVPHYDARGNYLGQVPSPMNRYPGRPDGHVDPRYGRPAYQNVHPQLGPAPSPGASDSREESSAVTGVHPGTHQGVQPGDSGDDSGGYHDGRNSDQDEDSRESGEEDSEEGYDYYHPPPRPHCPVVADLVIMLDGSDSLTQGNFDFGKAVIDQIISQLYLSPYDGFVVGALVFSDSIQEIRLRPFKDNVYLRSLVSGVYQEMGGTGTDYVLYNMRRLFFAEGRIGVPKIGVLMTDGRARNPSTTIEQARMAKLEGVSLISVAIGVVTNPLELQAVASSPSSVILRPTAAKVLQAVQSYSSVRCPDAGTGPYPVPYPTPGTGRPPVYPTPPRPSIPGQPTPVYPTPVYPTPVYPTPVYPTPRPPSPRPPTPSRPTPRPPRKGPCDDCKFLNGVGYNPHESVCSYYYQCFNNSGVLIPYQRECPFGLFWDQVDLTCKPPAAVDCAADPCKKSPRSYPARGNCRAYWQCRWGRTISAECCSYSHSFSRRRGCVFDYSCTVPCPPSQPTRPDVCNKRPYLQDNTQYYEDIGGGRTILRRCALGSAFVPAPVCRCDVGVVAPPRPWECRPDLYMSFDNNLRDESGQQVAVFTDRVTIDRTPGNGAKGQGAAKFNGNGKILVWKYANADLGDKLLIRLRYKPLPASGVNQSEGLLTNSDCREPCSISISYDRRRNTTLSKLRTEDTRIVRGLLQARDDWNDVEYKYDGTRLTFTVNGNSQSLAARGNIAKVPASLQIGSGCMGYDPFTGLIDELYVYNCIP